MSPEERATSELESQFHELGRRAAAGGGALAALVSLWWGAPVDTACFRGGLVWLAVVLGSRYGSRALARAASIELRARSERDSG